PRRRQTFRGPMECEPAGDRVSIMDVAAIQAIRAQAQHRLPVSGVLLEAVGGDPHELFHHRGCRVRVRVWRSPAGIFIRRILPHHHLNSESKNSVKLRMGLVGTMAALVLGLLVASAKGSYDA